MQNLKAGTILRELLKDGARLFLKGLKVGIFTGFGAGIGFIIGVVIGFELLFGVMNILELL